jgi:hypothetical protein
MTRKSIHLFSANDKTARYGYRKVTPRLLRCLASLASVLQILWRVKLNESLRLASLASVLQILWRVKRNESLRFASPRLTRISPADTLKSEGKRIASLRLASLASVLQILLRVKRNESLRLASLASVLQILWRVKLNESLRFASPHSHQSCRYS